MSDKYPGGFVTANAPAGFSVAFDGSGDILTTPSSANLAMGTGAFTVECWFYTNGNGSDGLISAIDSGSGNYSAAMYFSGSTTMKISIQSGVAAAFDSGNITFTPYTWNHAVLVRDGSGNCAAFFNGTRRATGTTSQNITQNLYNIGRTYVNTGAGTFNGYISNVRIVKGTAVYDPTQTTLNVPTQLFPVTNTQLLTCQSPTIIDNSTNNFAITVSGNAAVSNFTPFAGYTGFNPALGAAAGGVWTLDEAAYYQNNRQWPIYDPYFKNTTLMLHGNGTNGAQNNTFLDSSTNNFTITRNGNTTQGTFTPFSQTGWSSWFDGTSNTASITTPQNAAFNFGTGDFSVEAWVYATATQSVYPIVQLGYGAQVGGPYTGWSMNLVDLTSIQFYRYDGTETRYTFSVTIPQNTWVHIAVTRSSSSMRAFVNGVQIGAAQTATTSYNNVNSDPLIIGKAQGGAAMSFPGYISNVRVIKGSAVYTNSFTPSTQPLTAVTNTVLLACQNSRLVDNSANNFPFSTTGSTSVQAFSPFVPAYITPTTYSNWFEGSNDYLATGLATGLDNISGDFTIEYWQYPASGISGIAPVIGSANGGFSGTASFFAYESGTNKLHAYLNATQSSSIIAYTATYSLLNTWSHIAWVRSGSTLSLYLNGVSVATVTYTSTISLNTTNSNTYIGKNGWDAYYWLGCISNLRVVKGTAVYTTNFTPPTAPLTNITNTQLLTCQNSTFVDNSTNAYTITANGNVQPVTSPTPFPAKVDTTTLNSAYSTSLIGGSGYFDGTTASTVTTNQIVTVGTQDFCLEAWVYCVSTTSYACIVGNDTAGPGTGMFIEMGTARGIWLGGPEVSLGGVQYNRWVHLVFSRVSGTYAGYVNGIRQATGTFSTNLSNSIKIGVNNYVTGTTTGAGITGYISGVRVIVGSSPYLPTSTAFAPPIAPPTPVTNTQLLLNYTNGAIFDNTAKNVVETVGNAQISTTQSKWGGGSMYFDGSGDSLLTTSNAIFSLGSSDFTVEFWLYPISTNYGAIMYSTNNGSKTDAFAIYAYGSGQSPANSIVALITNSGGAAWSLMNGSSFGLTTAGAWQHVALVRNGSTFKGYLNGVAGFTVTSTSAIAAFNGFSIASNGASGDYFNGYIDDLRITRAARYFTNFTPPTSQLQDQ